MSELYLKTRRSGGVEVEGAAGRIPVGEVPKRDTESQVEIQTKADPLGLLRT